MRTFTPTSAVGIAPARPVRRQPEPVRADGRFLTVGGDVFRVRGVTYGSFRPRSDGELFPDPVRIQADFAAMAEAGLNTVRTYNLPPADLLDAAAAAGLRVLVGLDYHDWRIEPSTGRRARRRILAAGRRAVEAAVERVGGRPEVLAVAVGNEVPGDLVRVHGIGAVEETLSTLVAELHASPGLLATYVNYPTTEYLRVEGQDLACFNVFLEEPEKLEAYLRHLQIVSGEVPLVIAELGLASEIHGQEAQADALAAQLRLTEECGTAGVCVFSWTDEWTVGGRDVDGWGFGVTHADRRPKPALDVLRAWTRFPLPLLRERWPRVSVVVCAYNEAPLIGRCLASLAACDYPDLEVIVCDDGSADGTLEIARSFPFRVLGLPHGGLSRARNAGIEAATGEIVAFLDADAECHPEWPFHLVLSLETGVAATGGPNLQPPGRPFVERVVDIAPGGPIHVLIGDDRAEHVPGCNMAFRKSVLDEVGGFDPVYTSAGDDVDLCWRLLELGHEIGFAPAAQVHHHRPASVRDYLGQQRSYGRAESMLASRYRHRFNSVGQARWSGLIYTGPRLFGRLLRPVVYHGLMGVAPFQKVTRHRAEEMCGRIAPLLPLTVPLALPGALAVLSPWWLIAPAASLAIVLSFAAAVAAVTRPARGEPHPLALRALAGALHALQPFVRTWGRIFHRAVAAPAGHAWSGNRAAWLTDLMRALESRRCFVRVGGPTASWDLSVSIGPMLACRITTAVVWGWTPRIRIAFRPRLLLLAAAVVSGGAAFFDPVASGIALAALTLEAAGELVFVGLAVRSAVAGTTRGSA